MPATLRLTSPEARVRWWDGYVATYLERRNPRQISQIDLLADFRQLMELLALRCGQLLNQSSLARDARMSQPTVHRYLNLLETTHLFNRLPAFTASRTTRLLKTPKALWNDPGLAVFLSGYYQEKDLRSARELGSYFEAFIYHHLHVLAGLMTPPGRLFAWRTQQGKEVDFVLEHGQKILGVEVKMTDHPTFKDADGLRAFLPARPSPGNWRSIRSDGGQEIRWMSEKIMAVPWSMLTG